MTAARIQPYVDPEDVLLAAVDLFAARPDLLHQLSDSARRQKIREEAGSLFNYLFVGASHPALGANYNVVGYRLREVHQSALVDRTADGDLSNLDHAGPQVVS